MADKMAAKTWFIMKVHVVYINVEVVFFQCILLTIAQYISQTISLHLASFSLSFILKKIYIDVKNVCIYNVVLNVDSVDVSQ